MREEAKPSASWTRAQRGYLSLAALMLPRASRLWNGKSQAVMCHRMAAISASVKSRPDPSSGRFRRYSIYYNAASDSVEVKW